MLEIIVNIILIATIIVFIVDLSGSIEHLVKPIVKHLLHIPSHKDITLPLIECSLCVVWWLGLLYICIVSISNAFTFNQFLILVSVLALVSFLTPTLKDILVLIKDLIIRLIEVCYKQVMSCVSNIFIRIFPSSDVISQEVFCILRNKIFQNDIYNK